MSDPEATRAAAWRASQLARRAFQARLAALRRGDPAADQALRTGYEPLRQAAIEARFVVPAWDDPEDAC
jgi:hypothetical protein